MRRVSWLSWLVVCGTRDAAAAAVGAAAPRSALRRLPPPRVTQTGGGGRLPKPELQAGRRQALSFHNQFEHTGATASGERVDPGPPAMAERHVCTTSCLRGCRTCSHQPVICVSVYYQDV